MSHPSESSERHLEAGRRALSLGDVATAETELRAAIADAEAADAGGLLEAALGTYAQLLYHARRFAEAAPVFRRALELRERAADADGAGLVPSLHNLAAVLLAAGKPDEAEPLLRRALAILEKTHGPEHPELAGILNGLSQLCLKRGAHADAEPLLKRLLNIRRAEGGEERPEVATVMASLATVHHALAEHDAAERLLRRVLEIRERTLAPNHFAIATTLEALADTCATRGKLDEALVLLERALDIRERTLGPTHASLAVVRAKIADLQLQLSNDAFAVPLMEPIADVRRAELPTASARAIERPTMSSPVSAMAAPPLPLTDFRPPAAMEDERDSESNLSVAYLPTGSALVLPGERTVAPRATPDLADEELDFDTLTTDDARPGSLLSRPATRFAILGGVLILLGGAGALVARGSGADTGDGFVDAPASARDARPQSTVGGTVALPTPDAAALPSDSTEQSPAPPSGPHSSSDAPVNRPAELPSRETRRPASSSSSTPAAPASPSPIVVRGIDGVDLRGNAAAGLDIRTTTPVGDLSAALGTQRSNRSSAAYLSAEPSYEPAAILVKPQPRYPVELRRAGITGEVTMSFIVDTTGRIEASSIRVVKATDVRFVPSVTDLLPQLRFTPAESAGVKVPQRVSMPFKFQREPESESNPE